MRLQCAAFGAVRLTDQVAENGWKAFYFRRSPPCSTRPHLRHARKEKPMGQRTPLYDLHLALGAKMVDFGGWDMPLHYGSQVEEHHQVRRDCGCLMYPT